MEGVIHRLKAKWMGSETHPKQVLLLKGYNINEAVQIKTLDRLHASP